MFKNKKKISIYISVISIIAIALIVTTIKNNIASNEKVATKIDKKRTEQTQAQPQEQQPQQVAQATPQPQQNKEEDTPKVNVIEDNRVGGEGNQQTIKTNNGSAPQQQSQSQQSKPTPQPQAQQEQKPTQQGIQTQYGDHTYGVRNQDEYNKVMNKVRVAASTVGSQQIDEDYMAYLNGDRAENYPEDSDKYRALKGAERSIGYMNLKCGKDATIKWMKVQMAANKLARSANAKNPYDGSPSSAYDVLYNGLVDCDANSQVKSAVYDASGFETSVRYANGHAWEVVKVGNIWWDNEGVPSGLNGNALSNPN
ncbi:hypothetical protein [Clostridium manihotivorum]|uniref:Uncharacterized protein n=1 Tax=Clostridium manihotivorum TaxID=2320868 RepID=A0A410DPE7_9CLOT|nr:hypothetical protein [Clostridium manihotivorum]QAA30959.1 hypothetical protein C1I91_04355 [Clostridium manihotivorum]